MASNEDVAAEAKEKVERAVKSGSCLIAVFRYKDGTLDLDRVSMNFPFDQISPAFKLLRQNLTQEVAGSATPAEPVARRPSLSSKRPAKQKGPQ